MERFTSSNNGKPGVGEYDILYYQINIYIY